MKKVLIFLTAILLPLLVFDMSANEPVKKKIPLKFSTNGGKISRGIQWYLTRKVYTNYSVGYNSTYTGLVQDLIDSDGFKAGSSSVTENVSGFSIAEVEQSVLGMGTWISWKNNIKNKYQYNSTIGNIDSLFSIW